MWKTITEFNYSRRCGAGKIKQSAARESEEKKSRENLKPVGLFFFFYGHLIVRCQSVIFFFFVFFFFCRRGRRWSTVGDVVHAAGVWRGLEVGKLNKKIPYTRGGNRLRCSRGARFWRYIYYYTRIYIIYIT